MLNEKLLERISKPIEGFVCRPAGLTDFQRVLALYLAKLEEEEHMELTPEVVASAASALLDVLHNPVRGMIVCDHDGEIAGQLVCDIVTSAVGTDNSLLMSAIYAVPEHRALGVAQWLLAECVTQARRIGVHRLLFFHGPEGCSKFYERTGAEVSRIEYEVILP
jgi:GNAT superfamily N-acetyltransferase